MYRRVSRSTLVEVWGDLDITFTLAERRINESSETSVNSDFKPGV